jgi:hypothetical protein
MERKRNASRRLWVFAPKLRVGDQPARFAAMAGSCCQQDIQSCRAYIKIAGSLLGLGLETRSPDGSLLSMKPAFC